MLKNKKKNKLDLKIIFWIFLLNFQILLIIIHKKKKFIYKKIKIKAIQTTCKILIFSSFGLIRHYNNKEKKEKMQIN